MQQITFFDKCDPTPPALCELLSYDHYIVMFSGGKDSAALYLGYDNDSCKNGPFARSDASQREIRSFMPSAKDRLSLFTRSVVKNQGVCLGCQSNPAFSPCGTLGSPHDTGRYAMEMPAIAVSLAR